VALRTEKLFVLALGQNTMIIKMEKKSDGKKNGVSKRTRERVETTSVGKKKGRSQYETKKKKHRQMGVPILGPQSPTSGGTVR